MRDSQGVASPATEGEPHHRPFRRLAVMLLYRVLKQLSVNFLIMLYFYTVTPILLRSCESISGFSGFAGLKNLEGLR